MARRKLKAAPASIFLSSSLWLPQSLTFSFTLSPPAALSLGHQTHTLPPTHGTLVLFCSLAAYCCYGATKCHLFVLKADHGDADDFALLDISHVTKTPAHYALELAHVK
jgi:hypothetical protein